MKQKRISDTIPRVSDDGVRKAQRVPLEGAVAFLQPEGVIGHAVDASHDGIRIVTDEELTPGQKCIALVQLSTGDATHERMEVVWRQRSHRGWEVGLKFAS